MKFYIFSTRYKQLEKPTCIFSEWDKDAMYECGDDAVGSAGAHAKGPLCEKHFKYAQGVYGVSDVTPSIHYHPTERSSSRKPVI